MHILVNLKSVLGIAGFHGRASPAARTRDLIYRTLYVIGYFCTTVSFVWYTVDHMDDFLETMFGVVNMSSIGLVYVALCIRCDEILDLIDHIQLKVEDREYLLGLDIVYFEIQIKWFIVCRVDSPIQ